MNAFFQSIVLCILDLNKKIMATNLKYPQKNLNLPPTFLLGPFHNFYD